MLFRHLFNHPLTPNDRLLGTSQAIHQANLKRSLTTRLNVARSQENVALLELLEAEARYLDL